MNPRLCYGGPLVLPFVPVCYYTLVSKSVFYSLKNTFMPPPPSKYDDEPLPWSNDDSSKNPSDEAADDEYTLLPPDPEILAAEKARHKAQAEVWVERAEKAPKWEEKSLGDSIQFQFSLKDIFVFTGLVAVGLTAWLSMGPCAGFLIFMLSVLGWLHIRIWLQEQAELRKKRIDSGQPVADLFDWKKYAKEFASYSVKDLFVVTTVAAVLLTLMKTIGTTYTTALMGAIVSSGVVALIMGARPSIKIFRLWVLIVLFYTCAAVLLALTQ